MTIKFKTSSKPTSNPTQSTTMHLYSNPTLIFDDLPETPTESTAMDLYSLVVLVTKRTETPVWDIWEQSVFSSWLTLLSFYKELVITLNSQLKAGEITGYKIISVKMSASRDVLMYLPDYCITKFQPKTKVYINGPQTDHKFLSEKAKHYANANNKQS